MPKPTYKELLARYAKEHGGLVEPRQGWGSLHKSMWLAYSMGRKRGYTDLGTYVDKPLDHGWDDVHRMARAYDLGRRSPKFWQRAFGQKAARAYLQLLIDNHEALGIDYVIYRDKIWSRAHGWHYYGPDKSHFWHIHVSGSVGKDL
jgi:hypothetical protein